MSFSNKVVIITGAGSGMGKATALLFAKNSASLVLIDINEDNLIRVADMCRENYDVKVSIHAIDLTMDGEVKKVITIIAEAYNAIDVLVNCAGIYGPGGIKHDNIIEVYDKVMAINIRSLLIITHLAIPYLIKQKGCIINISSISSTCVTDNCLPYNISKAAVDHFNRCVALELSKDGVRVNSINPGPVETDILIHAGMSKGDSDVFWKNTAKQTPLGSNSKVEEIAELIVYLASDKARSITGVNFVIDNGVLLKGTQRVPDPIN